MLSCLLTISAVVRTQINYSSDSLFITNPSNSQTLQPVQAPAGYTPTSPASKFRDMWGYGVAGWYALTSAKVATSTEKPRRLTLLRSVLRIFDKSFATSLLLLYSVIKAKFRYAIWFEAGSKLVADLQRAEIWPII